MILEKREAFTIFLAPFSEGEPGLDMRYVQNVPNERQAPRARGVSCMILGE
jgi:hypothetical protein